MNKEELYRIAQEAVREEELLSCEIPNIDLYVDQILNLVSEKNSQGAARYQGRQLTKTMINNYSKDGLITPVKGKKYNKEQIIQMLSIYSLKNTLSIGEIKRLLDGEYAIEGYEGTDLARTYDRYIDLKRQNQEYSCEILSSLMDKNELDIENDRDFLVIVGGLLSLGNSLKNIAQELIDVKYPQAVEEPEKEKPKKEKKKKKSDAEDTEE